MEKSNDFMDSTIRHVRIDPAMEPCLTGILRQGFRIRTRVGCSVSDVLIHDIGIDPDYLKNRIQTIFLNGKAIDQPDRSILMDGATLALSAAMPGLVGATLRKGGAYAPFRRTITDTVVTNPGPVRNGIVTVRLFNFIAREIGPLFLKKGIFIPCEELRSIPASQMPEPGRPELWVEGISSNLSETCTGMDPEDWIFLTTSYT